MKTLVFGDYFEAVIAAAQLRNEGYAVDVFDEAVSLLWGPMSVGGVRLFVHGREEGEVADENDGGEVAVVAEGFWSRFFRWFVMFVLCSGVFFLVGGLLMAASLNPVGLSMVVLTLLVLVVGAIALAGIAESTKKLSRYPLVIGIGAALSFASILFVGIGLGRPRVKESCDGAAVVTKRAGQIDLLSVLAARVVTNSAPMRNWLRLREGAYLATLDTTGDFFKCYSWAFCSGVR